MTWALGPSQSYTAQTLPYPSVNLSVTNTEADVTGLTRRCYYRHLEGSGYAIGARFRPGCFRPFVDWPVSVLTNRHRPITGVLGRSTDDLERRIAGQSDPQAGVDALATFLGDDWPAPDAMAQRLADLVALIASDRAITRVAQVAELAELTVRSLQRIFADYVGRRTQVGDPAMPAAGRGGSRRSRRQPSTGPAWPRSSVSPTRRISPRAFTATIGVAPAAYARQASAD